MFRSLISSDGIEGARVFRSLISSVGIQGARVFRSLISSVGIKGAWVFQLSTLDCLKVKKLVCLEFYT